MKLDIKTVFILATLLFTGAGFYYTTQNRLDDLEAEILFLNRQLGDVQKQTKRLNRLVSQSKQQGDNK